MDILVDYICISDNMKFGLLLTLCYNEDLDQLEKIYICAIDLKTMSALSYFTSKMSCTQKGCSNQTKHVLKDIESWHMELELPRKETMIICFDSKYLKKLYLENIDVPLCIDPKFIY